MVVQDVKSYKKLLDAIDRAEAIEGIRRGLEDVKAGRTRPAKEVHNELLKKYGISR
jgi:predicted transcriptional regulator